MKPSLFNVIEFSAMVIIYIAIWIIQDLVYKKEVDDINKSIEVMKSREDA